MDTTKRIGRCPLGRVIFGEQNEHALRDQWARFERRATGVRGVEFGGSQVLLSAVRRTVALLGGSLEVSGVVVDGTARDLSRLAEALDILADSAESRGRDARWEGRRNDDPEMEARGRRMVDGADELRGVVHRIDRRIRQWI